MFCSKLKSVCIIKIRELILIALSFLSVTHSFSQSSVAKNDSLRKKVTFEIAICHVGWGQQKNAIFGDINPESKLLISPEKKVFSIGVFEFRTVFYNKFGLSTTLLDIEGMSISDKNIYNRFNDYFPNYSVTIPKQTEDTDESSYHSYVDGSNQQFSFSLGLFGVIPIKNFQISPFFNYLFIPTKNKYSIEEALFTDLQTNDSFLRNYKMTEKYNFGCRAGFDIRYNFKVIFLGIRTNFSYYKTKGSELIKDYKLDNTEISTSSKNYNHNYSTYTVNAMIGVRF